MHKAVIFSICGLVSIYHSINCRFVVLTDTLKKKKTSMESEAALILPRTNITTFTRVTPVSKTLL